MTTEMQQVILDWIMSMKYSHYREQVGQLVKPK